MSGTPSYLTFTVEAYRVALPVAAVRRVTQAVAVQPLPEAPEDVVGGIVVAEEPVPVVDLRARFGLPVRPLRLEDQFVIVAEAGLDVALWVDAVEAVVPLAAPAPGAPAERRIYCDEDGLLVIHDVAHYLSPRARDRLREALSSLSS